MASAEYVLDHSRGSYKFLSFFLFLQIFNKLMLNVYEFYVRNGIGSKLVNLELFLFHAYLTIGFDNFYGQTRMAFTVC